MLALWFKGYAYVPLSSKNPVERNQVIVAESGIRFILDSGSHENIAGNDVTLIFTGGRHNETCCIEEQELFGHKEETEVYILFTSGSTGVPKGVPINFGNLSAFCASMDALPLPIVANDRCLQMFDLTFDVSVASFMLPLLGGACVFTVPPDVVKYLHIVRLMKKYQLTVLTIVPSVVTLLKPYLKDLSFPEVKYCIFTAEASYTDLVAAWQQCVPGANIWNLYGPTEATIWCTGLAFSPENAKQYNGMFAIGKPLKQVEAIICNVEGIETGVNEKGELLVSGAQITTGYLNNTKQNEHSFVTREYNGKKQVFYKTGDYCYKDADGDIYYCGRLDNQVQIQGFRVELSEIEIQVREHFRLNNIVVPVTNKFGSIELILVLETGTEQVKEEVADLLRKKLAHYMIPSGILCMQEFPLNQSGKTDRKAIKNAITQ